MKAFLFQIFVALILTTIPGFSQQYTWTKKADFGPGNRFVPFYFSIGEKGYAGSGITISSGGGYEYIHTDFWEYDTNTDIWTQKANILGSCRSGAAGFAVLGKGYVTTGWTPSAVRTTIEYDPASNAWTPKNDFGGSARYSTSYFVIGDFAYVGMGYAPLNNDFWRYDAITDSWSQVASIGGTPRQAATGFSVNGQGYVFGGTTALSSETNELWAYNPAVNSWSQKASMPGAARYGASAFVMNGLGIVGVGASGPTIFNDFYAYDPMSDSWSGIPSLPADPRYGGFAFSINNRGYIGAGNAGIAPSSNLRMDFWELSSTIPSIAITGSLPNEFCAGTGFILNYNAYGTYSNGNVFTAQLSDAQGNFSVPVDIGNAISTATGSINIIIPAGTAAGNGYRIRVVSTIPAVTGSDNGSDLLISTNIPATPGTINAVGGNTKVCPGDSRNYTILPVLGATSYIWIPPSGATVANGQGTTSVAINYSLSFTTSQLKVQAVNSCGSSAFRNLKITKGSTAPSAPGTMSGPATGICNLSGIGYSVPNVNNVTYHWSFNAPGAVISSGQGTNSISVDFSGFSTGTLSVTATNGCGTSAARTKSISAIPSLPGAISGVTSVCANQQAVPYSIVPVFGAATYTWIGPTGSRINDGNVISPGNTLTTTASAVTVNFGTSGGNVRVRSNNACGSSSFRKLNVTVNCRNAAINMNNVINEISIYPNPVQDVLYIKSETNREFELIVYDMMSRKIVQQHFNSNSIINTSGFTPGIYYYFITDLEGNFKNGSIIKQ